MNSDETGQLKDLAVKIAHDTGAVLLDFASRSRSFIDTKSSSADLVTDADKACEQFLVDAIVANRPDDGILGEEGAQRDSSSGIQWIIDPIDGTTNFVYSIPFYAISVGVACDGIPIAGAVYNPVLDEMYSAHEGGGAYLNDSPIHVNQTSSLETALLATGFSYSSELRTQAATRLQTLIGSVRDIRRMGSAALDLCSVASGRVDAYYEQSVNIWDIAAGTIIAREAGAKVSGMPGRPDNASILAAAPAIYEELASALAEKR